MPPTSITSTRVVIRAPPGRPGSAGTGPGSRTARAGAASRCPTAKNARTTTSIDLAERRAVGLDVRGVEHRETDHERDGHADHDLDAAPGALASGLDPLAHVELGARGVGERGEHLAQTRSAQPGVEDQRGDDQVGAGVVEVVGEALQRVRQRHPRPAAGRPSCRSCGRRSRARRRTPRRGSPARGRPPRRSVSRSDSVQAASASSLATAVALGPASRRTGCSSRGRAAAAAAAATTPAGQRSAPAARRSPRTAAGCRPSAAARPPSPGAWPGADRRAASAPRTSEQRPARRRRRAPSAMSEQGRSGSRRGHPARGGAGLVAARRRSSSRHEIGDARYGVPVRAGREDLAGQHPPVDPVDLADRGHDAAQRAAASWSR